MKFKILIIDDDATQRKICLDEIELFNKANEFELELIEATNKQEGLKLLKEGYPEAAIVDLRLENNDTTGQGNDLLREIKTNLRIPVRIVSGNLGDLDEDLQDESYFYKKYNRDDVDYNVVFSDFTSIYRTGITKILNNKGQIESHITNIFWKHISTILPTFIDQKNAQADWDIERVLLRYLSLHIQEYLELSIDNNLEPFHNIEYYIKPPVKDKLFTGDILKEKENGMSWFVITPACDLATEPNRPPKAKYVTLIGVDTYEIITNGRADEDIIELKKNNLGLKYHFLPQTILFKGGFLNFQRLLSVKLKTCSDEYEVECVITNPFKKDIISRFSNYYARQGQPVFSE
jgi:CheY-like chemotaxis protein